MAQVRKFAPGGPVEEEAPKYGKFTIDGHDIDLEDYYKYASGLSGQDRAAAMDIYNSVRSGNDVDYNSGSNKITGVNWTGFNAEGAARTVDENGNDLWTRRRANREARRQGSGDAFVRALQKAGAYTKSEDPVTPYQSIKGSHAIDFNEVTGEDGKKSWIYSDSLSNSEAMEYFNKIRDIVTNWNDEEYQTKYRGKDAQGNDTGDYDWLNRIYQRAQADPEFWNNLEAGIRSASDDGILWDNLDYLGFSDGRKATQVASSGSGTGDTTDPWAGWKNPFAGTVDDQVFKDAGVHIVRDDQGNLVWDNFGEKGAWLLSDYDFLKGTGYEDGIMLDGRMYTRAEIEGGKNNPDTQRINDLINQTRAIYQNNPYDAAVQQEGALAADNRLNYRGIGQGFGGGYNPHTHYSQQWYDFFRNLHPDHEDTTYNIADVSAGFLGLPQGGSVVAYIDPHSQMDYYGYYRPSYVYRDASGKYTNYGSRADLISALGLREGAQQYNSGTVQSTPFNEHNFSAIRNVRLKGKNTPTDIYAGRDGTFRVLVGKKYRVIKPGTRTYEILVEGKGNPSDLTEQEMSADLVDTNIWGNNKDGSEKVKNKRDGGVLKPLPKLQFGDKLYLYDTKVGNVDNVQDNKSSSINEASGFNNGDLTTADWMELGAIAGDLVGFGLSFVPGAGNVASGVVGLGSTATQFAADVKRDGLDWGDAGRAGVGLVLDIAGLIPVAGSAAKAGKVTKTITKAAPLIKKGLKAAQMLGYGAAAAGAIETVDNIANGKDFTVDDVRNIAMVLQSVIGGGRSIYRNSAKKAAVKEIAAGNPQKIKLSKVATPKNANLPELELSQSEIDSLRDLAKQEDGQKKVGDKLASILRSKGYRRRISDSTSLAEDYGLIGKDKKWYNPATWRTRTGSADTGVLPTAQKQSWLSRLVKGRVDWNAEQLSKRGAFKQAADDIALGQTKLSEKAQRGVRYFTQESPELFGDLYVRPKEGGVELPWYESRVMPYHYDEKGRFVRNRRMMPTAASPESTTPSTNPRVQNLVDYPKSMTFSNVKKNILDNNLNENDILALIARAPSNKRKHLISQIANDSEIKSKLGSNSKKLNLFNKYIKSADDLENTESFSAMLSKIRRNRSLSEFSDSERATLGELLARGASRKGKLSYKDLRNLLSSTEFKFKKGGVIKAQIGIKSPIKGPFSQLYSTWNYTPDRFNLGEIEGSSIVVSGGSSTKPTSVQAITGQTPQDTTSPGTIKQPARTVSQNELRALAQKAAGESSTNPFAVDLSKYDTTVADENISELTPGSEGEIAALAQKAAGSIPTVDLEQYNTGVPDENVVEEDPISLLTEKQRKQVLADTAPKRNAGAGGLETTPQVTKVNWGQIADLGMSAGRLATSLSMNRRQHDALAKGIKAGYNAMESNPTEIYNRFQDNGVTAAYNALANSQRQTKGTSRDYLTNFAIEQSQKAQADQTELEGKLKLGEMYGQHRAEQNALRRQYADQRAQVDNRNRQRVAQLKMQEAQNDAAQIANNHQSLSNFSLELQNRLSQYNQKMDAWNNNYAAMNFQNQSLPVDQRMSQERIDELMDYSKPRGLTWKETVKKRPTSAKKGTKLQTIGSEASEKIWAENNKATAQAVKKIHESIIKLFMKATS